MKEKMINLLGIRPNGVILCRSKSTKGKPYIVIMESITEEEEERIDKSLEYYGEIRHVKKDNSIITSKSIYMYGEIDFNNKDDINNIKRFNFINEDITACNWMYSNFNFEKGYCVAIDNIVKGYPTWNTLQWFMYNYVLLGKPKRVIIYKKIITKRR